MWHNFSVQFDCDNSAFDWDKRDWEIVRLLEETIDKIKREWIEENYSRPIKDVNGNKIGNWVYKEYDELPF